MAAVLVALVPVGTLLALGGAYSTSTLPILAGAIAAFFVSGARLAARPETKALDLALAGMLAVVVLQIVPLPSAAVALLSPKASALQDRLALQPPDMTRPLSIDARLTREGLATLGSAVLLFWAARESFARGGVRIFTRIIALTGFVVALLAVIQRATAPALLLWRWKPVDPSAQPFGPFVNRNHFATWLLMSSALTAAHLVAHVLSRQHKRPRSTRLFIHDLLADGGALLLVGSLAGMLLALVASLSRAALLGLAVAIMFGLAYARRVRTRDRSIAVAGLMIAVLVAGALWVNRESLLRRVDAIGSGQTGRPVIWAETMPLIADFALTGCGVGTYGSAMLHYQRTQTDRLFNQAHSEYLQLMAEGGILLTVVVAVAAAAWLRLAFRRLAPAHQPPWIRVGAGAGVCAILVQAVFEAGLRMPANALLFAVLAAMVVYERRAGARLNSAATDADISN